MEEQHFSMNEWKSSKEGNSYCLGYVFWLPPVVICVVLNYQIGSLIQDTRRISSDETAFDKGCTRMCILSLNQKHFILVGSGS
jgi:hypothetical protein